MALTADQTSAMTALNAHAAKNLTPAKDLEFITNALVNQWALSAADAKTLRNGIHPGHGSFGPTL